MRNDEFAVAASNFSEEASYYMRDHQWLWNRDVEIPSDKCAIGGIIDQILGQLALYEWSDKDIFGVHLALEEALANAIKHGNRLDAGKKVRIWCGLAAERVRIEVTDEGAGFTPGSVPDPTAAENLEVPAGRGVFLIRHYMSHVHYNDIGNSVIMEKLRECTWIE